MTSTTYPPPPARRIVTSHDAEGKETIWIDEKMKLMGAPGHTDEVAFCVPFATADSPCDISKHSPGEDKDSELNEVLKRAKAPTALTNGTTVRWVDMPPKHISPMHRTVSLDYGILIWGVIDLVFPDGTRTKISEPGSLCVQRGTMHAWENTSDEWVRMCFILIPAKPVEVDGKKLDTVWH